VRKIFHWKYSQAVLPQLVRAWLAAVLAGKFRGPYPLLAVLLVWIIGWWRPSGYLVEQRMQSDEFAIYADPKIWRYRDREGREH
jgi:hypothetical protein